MKDGIQNMFDAYKKSPGNQNKNISNIKNGFLKGSYRFEL